MALSPPHKMNRGRAPFGCIKDSLVIQSLTKEQLRLKFFLSTDSTDFTDFLLTLRVGTVSSVKFVDRKIINGSYCLLT